MNFMAYKFKKTFHFSDWFLYKRQFIYSSQKGCKVLSKVRERSYHVIRRYTKGVPFSWKMVYKRVRGWTLGRNLPAWKFVEYPPGACVASVSEKLLYKYISWCLSPLFIFYPNKATGNTGGSAALTRQLLKLTAWQYDFGRTVLRRF